LLVGCGGRDASAGDAGVDCAVLAAAWQTRAGALAFHCTFDEDCAMIGALNQCACTRGPSGCGRAVRTGEENDTELGRLTSELRMWCGGGPAVTCNCGPMLARCAVGRCRAEHATLCGDAGP